MLVVLCFICLAVWVCLTEVCFDNVALFWFELGLLFVLIVVVAWLAWFWVGWFVVVVYCCFAFMLVLLDVGGFNSVDLFNLFMFFVAALLYYLDLLV